MIYHHIIIIIEKVINMAGVYELDRALIKLYNKIHIRIELLIILICSDIHKIDH